MNKNFMNIENTVNVYDFGADGTGVADSSEAFALAVLKAKNDKKTLYIPRGVSGSSILSVSRPIFTYMPSLTPEFIWAVKEKSKKVIFCSPMTTTKTAT